MLINLSGYLYASMKPDNTNFFPSTEIKATEDQTKLIAKIETLQQEAHDNFYKKLKGEVRADFYKGCHTCKRCGEMINDSYYTIPEKFKWDKNYVHQLKQHNIAINPDFKQYLNRAMVINFFSPLSFLQKLIELIK